MFCLLNNEEYEIKNITFASSNPMPEAPMGRGWADIYTYKAIGSKEVLV